MLKKKIIPVFLASALTVSGTTGFVTEAFSENVYAAEEVHTERLADFADLLDDGQEEELEAKLDQVSESCPDRVRPSTSQVVGAACGKTREELTSALERQPIDEDNARALLLQLAAEQYDAIGNTEYETVRLRRLLTGRMPMPELDVELLQSAVSKVRVTNNCVTVTLKNGQTIERRDQL